LSNEYQLVDGSPRYGSRDENHTPQAPAPAGSAIKVEGPAQEASRLGLDHLAAAIDRRLTSSWADRENALVRALREAHPEELKAARDLVRLHLGSQRQWRFKAQAVRDKHLAATMRRRRAAGSATEILFLRIGLIIALIAPPLYVMATSTDLLKLTFTGVACVAAAFAGGHFITIRSRVPAMPVIRGPWLAELREDVVNATLLAILLSKGVTLEARTVAAAQQGMKSIRAAASAVDALQG
jgi:hypothetical protein